MKRSDQPQSTSTSTANRTPSRLAWSLALLAATLSLVGVVVTVYYALTTGDMSHLLSHTALNPFIAIIYGIVGALVASRHPRNTIGWIFVSVAVLSALNIAVGVYGRYTVVSQSTGVTDVALANWLGSWFWLPTFFLPTIFVFYLFPDGRLPSRRWAVLFGAAAAGVAMVTAGGAPHRVRRAVQLRRARRDRVGGVGGDRRRCREHRQREKRGEHCKSSKHGPTPVGPLTPDEPAMCTFS